jgi:hypothetical protein
MPWFWNHVAVGGLDECWPWAAAKADGYGRFKIEGRLYSAHRIAYTLARGVIPPGTGYHGTIVMHACDNPACCNPLHLKLGTNRDNVRDMVAKGRRDFRSHMKPKVGALE